MRRGGVIASRHHRSTRRGASVSVSVSAALGDIERAKGQDYASAAACFVEAFFLGRGGKKSKGAEAIAKGELAYLNGAQKKDMVARYNQRGMGTMFVVKDDELRGAVVGCVGAEVQTFKGTTPLRRADENTKGEVVDRPVIANLATARAGAASPTVTMRSKKPFFSYGIARSDKNWSRASSTLYLMSDE